MKDWIYGKNAVYEAVKKNDGLTKVVLVKEGKDERLVAMCKKSRIPVEFEDRNFFNKNAKGNHQGYMALKESYEYVDLEDILARIPKGKQPLFGR
jgi:23S rRNA (guanosine2251-2'-O)-methyltransferase